MKSKGFTLIEVILSMAIIGIIAVSTLTMLNVSIVNIKRAGNRTTAVEQTESVIIDGVNAIGDGFTVTLLSSITDLEIISSTITISKITGTVSIEGMNGTTVDLEFYER